MIFDEIIKHFGDGDKPSDRADKPDEVWRLCPCHKDTTPSLHITHKDNKTMLYCHVCGDDKTAEDIAKAAGLTIADLFDGVPESRPAWMDFVEKLLNKNGAKYKVVKEYPYIRLDGSYALSKVRFEPKTFRYGVITGEVIDLKKDTLKQVIRRNETVYTNDYSRLKNASFSDETVYLVEGEKDVDSLAALGLLGVTFGSAKGWTPDRKLWFKDVNLVILPDCDEAGKSMALRVQRDVMDCVKSLKIVTTSEVDKGDVSDWLADGHDAADLAALVDQTEPERLDGLWLPITANSYEAPRDWWIDEGGIYYTGIDEKKEGIHIPTPVWVSGRYVGREIDGTEYERYELTYFKDGRKKTKTVEPEVLMSRSKTPVLSNCGILVNSGTAGAFVDYITSFIAQNADRIEKEEVVCETGWLDRGDETLYVPYNDEVKVIKGAVSETMRTQLSAQKGTLDDWIKDVGGIRRERQVARVVMAAGASALLLNPLEQPNFCVMLTGLSQTGKTACCKAMMSMYGDPGLIQTANTTQNGAEYYASFFKDYPVVFDEVMMVLTPEKAGQLIMDIANGSGRIRMTKDRKLDKIAHYRTIGFFTSEDCPISESANEGQRNRVIELSQAPFNTGSGSKEEADALVKLYAAMESNYGHAARVLAGFIPDHIADLRDIYIEIESGLGSTMSRHTKAAALIGTADYMLSTVIFGMAEDEAKKQALDLAGYIVATQTSIRKSEGSKSDRALEEVYCLIDSIKETGSKEDEEEKERERKLGIESDKDKWISLMDGKKYVGQVDGNGHIAYINRSFLLHYLERYGYDLRRLEREGAVERLSARRLAGQAKSGLYDKIVIPDHIKLFPDKEDDIPVLVEVDIKPKTDDAKPLPQAEVPFFIGA